MLVVCCALVEIVTLIKNKHFWQRTIWMPRPSYPLLKILNLRVYFLNAYLLAYFNSYFQD